MAKRPVFLLNKLPPHYEERNVEFVYYSGFADSQRKKSVYSFHQSILNTYPDLSILEVPVEKNTIKILKNHYTHPTGNVYNCSFFNIQHY